MLNFNRRFLPNADSIQSPFHDVLSVSNVKGTHLVNWAEVLITAFDECKNKSFELLFWHTRIRPLHSP
jgi:hypothetical protein